jgi:mannose-1-phosphate guanylyltransferase
MKTKPQPANPQNINERFMLSDKSRGLGDPLVCGIVMSGGEGKRVRPFIHLLRGDFLPKQYVNFIGTRSMLEHTFRRAEKLIPPQRIFTIINQAHLQYPEVRPQLLSRHQDTVIVQPENRETGPGILLPLMHLYKRYPDSIVALFPSDHFVLEEDRLAAKIRLACRAVHQDPSRFILLGIKPDGEEPDYGYILPGNSFNAGTHRAHEIARFVEKPERETAKAMILQGALWNTMLMIFKTTTLLRLVQELTPRLFEQFQRIYKSIGTPDQAEVTRNVYRGLETVNFSRDVLEPLARRRPSQLATFPIDRVLWSDWGTETRIMDILRRTGNVARLNGIQRTAHQDRAPASHGSVSDLPTPRTAPKVSKVKKREEAQDAERIRESLLTI